MKTYYYEINGYIKGVTTANSKLGVRKYCKRLAKTFCSNAKIKSLKISRLKNNEPLYTEV